MRCEDRLIDADLQVVGERFCELAEGLGGILVDCKVDEAGVLVAELDKIAVAALGSRRIRPQLVHVVRGDLAHPESTGNGFGLGVSLRSDRLGMKEEK